MVRHAFEPRRADDEDDGGPVWCHACEYHRDHLIHFGGTGRQET